MEPKSPPFFTRYGISRPSASADALTIEPYPEICVEGSLRATIVASAIDLVGGLMTREVAGVDATFTSDLSLRIPLPSCPDRLDAKGTRIRAGKRLVTTGVTLTQGDAVYAYGETTFARIARADDDAKSVAELSTPLAIPSHPLTQPLANEVGIEIVDGAEGRVRLAMRPALRNPGGVMQGALVALVVECAALAASEAKGERPRVVTEMDLRYLAAASKGPVSSVASWIGTVDANMLRIELRDAGQEDRLTTTALVRLAEHT